MPPVARGAAVTLEILSWDEVDLTVEARLIAVAQADNASEADVPAEDEEEDSSATVAAEAEGIEMAEGTPAPAAETPPAADPATPLSN
jgi:exoribonuclease-2